MLHHVSTRYRVALLIWAAGLASGCSVKTFAVKTVANTLSQPGDTFTRDDDPELIRAALPFGLSQFFGGRGVFMLMGAMMGTLMLLNVWIRILPNQAKMLKEAESGQVPDFSVGLKSKTRSVHNTYFIFPVLFIMLSNHYPTLYNHPKHSLLLVLLSVVGALTRHAMVTRSPIERWTLAPAAVGLAALVFMTAQLSDPQADLVRPELSPLRQLVDAGQALRLKRAG